MATWMIVEDDPQVYELLTEAFERWEIESLLFVDVDQALEWITLVDQGVNVGELPELVLLDLRFYNEIVGHLVGQQLRRSPTLKHLPIVIMTAQIISPQEHELYVRTVQPDAFLRKPLPRFSELKRKLDSIIHKRKKQTETTRLPRGLKS
ncbi:MAG: response regulator [Chloroflexi bacterium]|nr:response regulator [Chloroflexota bacterium]